MKAAVLTRISGPLELLDVQLADPAPDEVVVRVAASGICHSDKHAYDGGQSMPLPAVLGHEVAGVVQRTGADVRGLRPGDHVVTAPSGFCGRCDWCLSGLSHHCAANGRTRPAGQPSRLSMDGAPVTAFVGLGGFAEYLLVHESALCPVPTELPLDRAALLGCAVVTGFGAVLRTAEVRPGATVAVLGCGGVGLNVVQAARFAGAARIVALDRQPAKLERARHFGATDVVDASEGDAAEQVRELTGGGVEHAFEVVGRPETVEQSFAMLRPRGTTTMVGVPGAGDRASIPLPELLQEKRLQGSRLGSSRFRIDVDLYARLYLEGRIMLDELLSHRVGLAEAGDALAGMDTSTAARTVVVF
ncbi:Zn-dependent alcohol dehydrogenase [Prauserella cavernicola]|uniref:Zn-dependent alcohol dehydrogenase n=1 Tax=Prauserella cavernicola TaxID=2800127 RepID=A0A934QVS7_9PSEU|nr:Zn-dependent alcohol dehydrogenase [Prauserella cavernicola]MBK1787325.1 Zn-dependent alcohol dehydrogenase [Prauserella cavernicola]